MTQQEKWIKKFGADNVYNKHCEHLDNNDGYSCNIKMDMIHCNNRCAYATNVAGTNKVDKRGQVIGVR